VALYSWAKIELGSQYSYVSALDTNGARIFAGMGVSASPTILYADSAAYNFTLLYTFPSSYNRVASIASHDDVIVAGLGSGAGDAHIYRSDDAGLSFTKVYELPAEAPNQSIFDMKYLGGGVFVACSGDNGGRILRSSDDGVTWAVVKTVAETTCYTLACDNGNRSVVGKFSNTNKVETSIDLGLTYLESQVDIFNFPGGCISTIFWDGFFWVAMRSSEGASTANIDIYKSADLLSWTQEGSFAAIAAFGVSDFIVTDSGSNIYYGTPTQLWVRDGLGNWTAEATGITGYDVTWRGLGSPYNSELLMGLGWGSGDGDIWIGTPLFPIGPSKNQILSIANRRRRRCG
jgi:hypothetical protein